MDRVVAARERLDALKRDCAVLDVPCVDCDHLGGIACFHPAVQQWSLDPVQGSVSGKPVMASDARAANGPCGPDGELFEPKSFYKVAAAGMYKGLSNVGAALGLVGLGAVFLAMMLG